MIAGLLVSQARCCAEFGIRGALPCIDQGDGPREVTAAELTGADPSLLSLRNVNTPEEYAALTAQER